MPILTKPSTITKGEPASLSISKSSLVALSIVSGDAYWSNQANWSLITVVYKSTVGGQVKKVIFDATIATPTSPLLFSVRARDSFQVQRVDIQDFDSDKLSIPRASLVTAEFDVNMGVVAGPTYSRITPITITNSGNFIITGDLSDGVFTSDDQNYAYSTGNGAGTAKIDLGTTKSVAQIAIGLGGFSATPDNMNWVPLQITITSSNDDSAYSPVKVFNFASRAEFVANAKNDLLFDAPVSARYFKLATSSVNQSFGGATVFTEISCYSQATAAVYTRDFSNPNAMIPTLESLFGGNGPIITANKLVASVYSFQDHYHLNIDQIPSSPLVVGNTYKIRLTIVDYVDGFNDNSIFLWIQGGGLYPPVYYTSAQLAAFALTGYIELDYVHSSAIQYLRFSRSDNGFRNIAAILSFSKIEFIQQ